MWAHLVVVVVVEAVAVRVAEGAAVDHATGPEVSDPALVALILDQLLLVVLAAGLDHCFVSEMTS